MNINEVIQKMPNVTFTVTGMELKEMVQETIQESIKHRKDLEVQETYLTKSETATKLGVSVATLYRWQKQKYLEPVYIGAKPRYKLSDVKKILQKEK